MAQEKELASEVIYQIKVTLRGSKPPIWRRIQVAGDTNLGKLHRIIQEVMGWYNSHLHEFIIDGEHYGEPSPDDFFDVEDENKFKLSRVVFGEKSRLVYEYDFGDSWEHVLLVEKILPPEPGVRYPICLKGKRACPPEDCGGIWGYESLLEIIRDPEDSEHEEMLEWLGGEFDPEEFDLDGVNKGLERLR